MTQPHEVEAEILRLHYGEHWRIGTIARQLGIHADVVRRVLANRLGASAPSNRGRVTQLSPYRAFIQQTLDEFPTLRATRLYDMLWERGYEGSPRTVRDYVAKVRPKRRAGGYLRLETLAGEQAQIDWAHVGKIAVPGGERSLWAFVIVLSYSRAMWAELVIDTTVHSLCRSLTRAAAYFGGVTRQWLFDNPKIVVLQRFGDAVRFQPALLGLCAHLRVQPRLCGVRQPEDKGKVERAIRYLRDRFFAGRYVTDIDEGNRALLQFFDEVALKRQHPVQTTRRRRGLHRGARTPAVASRPAALDGVRHPGQHRSPGVHPPRHQPLLRSARPRRPRSVARVR